MFQLARNENHNKYVEELKGYKDCGWANGGYRDDSHEDVAICLQSNHKRREIDNSLFRNRGTDIIEICDEQKIFWHIDMGD